MRRILATLLVVAVFGSVLVGGYFTFWNPAPDASRGTNTEEPLEWRVETLEEEGDTYTISVEYPFFQVLAIDAAIRAPIDAGIADIRALPPNPPESAAGKHEFGGSIGGVYVSAQIVSAELLLWQYTGGAHALPVTVGVNVNPQTGRALTLDDALALTGKTLEEVSVEALAELNAELGENIIFAEGAAPTADNYGTFLINDTEVTFVFQVYQVAAYAAGPQKVVFPRVQ